MICMKKIALVTGGARGIGKAISSALLKDSDQMILVDQSVDELSSTVDELKNLNENIFIRSNNNTLILLNIDQIPLKFQKQFLFFIESQEFFKNSNVILDQKIISISE